MFNHLVQFYDSDAFLAQTVLEFIEPARQAGEGAIVIATKDHLDLMQAMLSPASAAAQRDGRDHCVFLDAREILAAFMVDRMPDEQRFVQVVGGLVRQVSEDGSRHISAFGEMVALLCAEGNAEAALRLEALWEGLARQHRFSLLCAYPLAAFPDHQHRDTFERICAAHSHVNPIERLYGINEPAALHRAIALLQQQANALQSELRRRREYEHVLESQNERIAALISAQARLESPAGEDAQVAAPQDRATPAPRSDEGAPAFLTLEATADRLRLSRPHVFKLILERRFRDVVWQDGGVPLIPLHEVSRVARTGPG